MVRSILKLITAIVMPLLFAAIGVASVIVFWFVTAQFESDPTVGGAYVAIAMLTAPFGGVLGAMFGSFLAVRVMKRWDLPKDY